MSLLTISILHGVAAERIVRVGREPVAAVFGNSVHDGAAILGFRRHPARLDDQFLDDRRVEEPEPGQAAAIAPHVLVAHVVEIHAGVFHLASVDRDARVDFAPRAASVVPACRRCPDRQDADALKVLERRQRIQFLLLEHVLLREVLHVDDGTRARYGHRFLDRSHFELGVHRRREPGRQLETFPPDGCEARQGEHDRVGAGPEIHDPYCP